MEEDGTGTMPKKVFLVIGFPAYSKQRVKRFRINHCKFQHRFWNSVLRPKKQYNYKTLFLSSNQIEKIHKINVIGNHNINV